MLCDNYKEALIEAAASGASLPSALREHVEACARCRTTVASEQSLFAAIDAGLLNAANARVPSGFLPNVKANLATETVPTRNPIPGWAFVCATGALALAAAFLNLPRGAHEQSQTESIAVPSKAPAAAGGVGLNFLPEHKIPCCSRVSKAHAQPNESSAASHKPVVLVQPEEEEFLKRFYSAALNSALDAKTVVADENEITAKPLVIEQIEVNDLKIENLNEESGLAQTGAK
jgi:hypothetical protein